MAYFLCIAGYRAEEPEIPFYIDYFMLKIIIEPNITPLPPPTYKHGSNSQAPRLLMAYFLCGAGDRAGEPEIPF